MKEKSSSPRLPIIWFFRMAWRDGYASRRKLVLFMASIVLGIAAVVSIQLFGFSLNQNISNQSKSLLGADLVIESKQPPNEKIQALIDSIKGEKAREYSFASMVSFPAKEKSRLAHVRALEGDFPFYGELKTEPASASKNFQEQGKALMDATVMLQYGLKPGDSIKVGELTFSIAGSITSSPGQSGISATVAPPVYIPFRYLDKTGLLQKGSRIEYQYYFKIAPDIDIQKLEARLEPVLEKENAEVDTHASIGKRLTKSYENFGRFLNVIGFTALLLGCIGVASAVNIYINEKINSVAILRSLGATRKQSFLIYLLQIACLGLFGAITGTLLGIILQQVFPLLLHDFLPVEIEIIYSPSIILMGVILGLIMSVLFALLPLMSIWDVSPLRVLRISETTGAASFLRRTVVVSIIFIFIFLFSWWQLNDWKYSFIFTIGIFLIFALLAGMGTLLMFLVKRFFPTSWSFSARQSLLNLYRPNNQTLILIISIGIGSFLISTLYFTKDLLLNKISFESGDKDPNVIIFDIQTEQVEQVKKVVRKQNDPVLQQIPIVTMRLQRLRGRETYEIRKDSNAGIKEWVLNREYRVTFRDSLTETETIVEGQWIGKDNPADDKIFISVESGLAKEMKASIGDELVFNVQGMLMKTTIGSIREVDWRRMQTNFLVLFPVGVLENAPQFHVVTTKVPDNAASARLQQALVKSFPNVSILDLRQVLATVGDIVNKISNVITFMAFFSILTGIFVLIGSVSISKYQRISESVLLRTLGAGKKEIFKIAALEYFFLGCFASSSGILLSFVTTSLLAVFSFSTVFIPPLIPALIIFAGITFMSLIVGLLNSRSVILRSPFEVLRKEI